MSLSFDDKESFMEATGSLRFNNFQSDSNITQADQPEGVGTQSQERSEDIGFNNPSNDSITTTLQRMGSSSQEIGEEFESR
jgi:hypothetical protein